VISNAERSALLARALRAQVAGDRDAMRDIYTDDVRAWTPALAVDSLARLQAEFDRRDEAFTDVVLEVVPLDVGGEFACAEWSVSMTHTGPFVVAAGAVVEPTGLRVSLNGVTVAEFRDDRICSLRQYWDEMTVFEQLGLLSDRSVPAAG
jgi:ketosteroid isomerase-like protein